MSAFAAQVAHGAHAGLEFQPSSVTAAGFMSVPPPPPPPPSSGFYPPPPPPGVPTGFTGGTGAAVSGFDRPSVELGKQSVQATWSGFPQGVVPESCGGGRNPYAPGDRVMWNLPELASSSLPDAALRCADWLISIRPYMNDLSPASAEWWSLVEGEADALYMRWQLASPLDRIRIVPEVSATLGLAAYQRLEARAYQMLVRAVPEQIHQDLVASRHISTVAFAVPGFYVCFSPVVWQRDSSCCKV